MTEGRNVEYDRDWLDAVKSIVAGLKTDGIHFSDRPAIVNSSVPIWEKYMLEKGHHGAKFAKLPVGRKVQMAATIHSQWDYRVFYIAILLGLTEDPNEIN